MKNGRFAPVSSASMYEVQFSNMSVTQIDDLDNAQP